MPEIEQIPEEPSHAEVHSIVQHGLSTRKQLIIFGLLGALVAASAVWLFLHKSNKPTTGSNSSALVGTVNKDGDFSVAAVSYDQSTTGIPTEVRKTAEQTTNADFTKNYGEALASLEANNYSKAVEQFELAVKAPGTKQYSFYTQMAYAYAGAGNKAKALEYFKLAKQTYNTEQAPKDTQETKDGINGGYDIQIQEFSK